MARDMGISVKEVRELDEVFAGMAPKIVQWQKDTQWRAHKEGYLTTPFGGSLDFFEVFTRAKDPMSGEWKWRPGKQSTECLAYGPQATCAGMLREVLVSCSQHPGYKVDFNLLVPEYDSLKGQVRIGKEAEVLPFIKETMEREWPELGGLSVKVEGKIGPDMNSMEEWK